MLLGRGTIHINRWTTGSLLVLTVRLMVTRVTSINHVFKFIFSTSGTTQVDHSEPKFMSGENYGPTHRGNHRRPATAGIVHTAFRNTPGTGRDRHKTHGGVWDGVAMRWGCFLLARPARKVSPGLDHRSRSRVLARGSANSARVAGRRTTSTFGRFSANFGHFLITFGQIWLLLTTFGN